MPRRHGSHQQRRRRASHSFGRAVVAADRHAGGRALVSATRAYTVAYGPPIIFRFVPRFFEPTTADTVVVIEGAYFASATIAFVDGAPASVGYVDSRFLRLSLPAGMLADRPEVHVELRNPGGQSIPGDLTSRLLPIFRPVEVEAGSRDRLANRCLIDANGTIQCWAPSPRPLAPHLRFEALQHNGLYGWCALTPAGAVYCWGANHFGQHGNGTRGANAGSAVPGSPVAGGHVFRRLAVGASHACALDDTQAAWCWGSNARGQLGTDAAHEACSIGDFSSECATRPVSVAGDLRFLDIAAGQQHTCGLTTDGRAHCWGSDGDGSLGNGAGRQDADRPEPVAGTQTFSSIVAHAAATCALTDAGAAYCWGQQPLAGTAPSQFDEPTPVFSQLAFALLSLGIVHGCGVTDDGGAFCWGNGFHGQLGGDPAAMPNPVRVLGEHRWTGLTLMRSSTCGIAEPGRVYCWGAAHLEVAMLDPPGPCNDLPLNKGGFYCYRTPSPVLGIREQSF